MITRNQIAFIDLTSVASTQKQYAPLNLVCNPPIKSKKKKKKERWTSNVKLLCLGRARNFYEQKIQSSVWSRWLLTSEFKRFNLQANIVLNFKKFPHCLSKMDGQAENMTPAAIAGTEISKISQIGRQEIENYQNSQPVLKIDDRKPKTRVK